MEMQERVLKSFCAGFNYSFVDEIKTVSMNDEEKENTFNDTYGKIVKYLLNNPDIEESTFLNGLSLDSSLSYLDKDLIGIFSKALYLIYKGHSRLEVWDALFASSFIENKLAYRVLLDSYYIVPDEFDEKNYHSIVLQTALHHFWHRTPFVISIRKSALLYKHPDFLAAVGALNNESFPTYDLPDF